MKELKKKLIIAENDLSTVIDSINYEALTGYDETKLDEAINHLNAANRLVRDILSRQIMRHRYNICN